MTPSEQWRRAQAARLYRALRAQSSGLSWKECFALFAGQKVVVGDLVMWMRGQGVAITATYDAVAGETRFVLPPRPLVITVTADTDVGEGNEGALHL